MLEITSIMGQEVEAFSFKSYRCRASCARVIDGDTYELVMDLPVPQNPEDDHQQTIGFNLEPRRVTCRLYGVNCPETRRRRGRVSEEEIELGLRAKAYVERLMDANEEFDVQVQGHGNFGRLLVSIELTRTCEQNVSPCDLAQHLLSNGFACEYKRRGR